MNLARGPLAVLVTLALGTGLGSALVLESGPSTPPAAALGDATDPATDGPLPPPLPTPTTPPPPPPPPKPKPKPVKAKGAPCLTTASACVKLSTNQAWLIKGGKAVYGPVKITHGRKGWLTPAGTFNVSHKNRNHKSRLFDDAPMPNSVFFNGGIAFHKGSLTALSHGCIHLGPAASERFYTALPLGAVVQVVR
jgi:hypothetical protein